MRLMTYNVEHFSTLFTDGNRLWLDVDPQTDKEQKAKAEAERRLPAIAETIKRVDPDLIGITEAPNQTTTSDNRDTVKQLEAFAQKFGLRVNTSMMGYISRGSQEIALLYDAQKLTAEHDPGGEDGSPSNPPFDQRFQVDSDADGIQELYAHYRPPLEARITSVATGEQFWLMVVHAKSKGIFDAMDRVHYDRASDRNRRKLFAECTSIRRRVEEWQEQGRDVVVMGDINDGPGFDYYEKRFGRSAIEIIIGDVFAPEALLANRIGRPTFDKFGWRPGSARFTDIFTGDRVNALIDHIVASPRLAPLDTSSARVWNPWHDKALKALPGNERAALKTMFTTASDHMPVTLDIPWGDAGS